MNCGIGGSLTKSYFAVLDSIVLRYNPKFCILQIGINDIRNKVSVDTTEKYYSKILDRLEYHKIEVIVTSIIPLRKDFWQDDVSETDINIKVDSINQKLIQICNFKNIAYLNINRCLAENNRLKREYTLDGIHLNNFGFDVFYQEINNYLKKTRNE